MINPGYFRKPTVHPYRVECLADLPVALQQIAGQSLAAGDPPETIIYLPQQIVPRKFLEPAWKSIIPEQALIFTTAGVWHLRAASPHGEAGLAAYLPGSTLLYAHLSLVLLYGRLELCGVGAEGLGRMVIEYNTVSHFLIQPALERLLSLAWGPASADREAGSAAPFFPDLQDATLKYRNGLRNYLLKFDQRLVGCILQPPITGRVFGLRPRKLAPPVLVALTDHQLVIIEEGIGNATSYGYYITYCPRRCIATIEFKKQAAWQEMIIHLSSGDAATMRMTRLEDTAAQAWQAVWAAQAAAPGFSAA